MDEIHKLLFTHPSQKSFHRSLWKIVPDEPLNIRSRCMIEVKLWLYGTTKSLFALKTKRLAESIISHSAFEKLRPVQKNILLCPMQKAHSFSKIVLCQNIIDR